MAGWSRCAELQVWLGELVGQPNLAVTAHWYTHVLTDEAEPDDGNPLECDGA
jgi:hypothetical protein